MMKLPDERQKTKDKITNIPKKKKKRNTNEINQLKNKRALSYIETRGH